MAEKKRFTVTIPHRAYENLKSWAKGEGSDAASLASFVLQTAIAQAESEGKIPPDEESEIDRSVTRVLDYLFKQADDCRAPDNLDIFNFAERHGYEVGEVVKLIDARKEDCCNAAETSRI